MTEDVEVVTESGNHLKITTASNDVCKKRGHTSLNGIVTDIKIHDGTAWQICKETKSEHWRYRETIFGGCSFGGATQIF
jgi:hypothetical protein